MAQETPNDTRLRAVESASQRGNDALAAHERECALRYAAFATSVDTLRQETRAVRDDIRKDVRMLVWAMAVLATVSLGQMTVREVMVAISSRVGLAVPSGQASSLR